MNSSALTLHFWYECHFVALFHDDASHRTIAEYQFTINAWERLTSNKTLDAITSISARSVGYQ